MYLLLMSYRIARNFRGRIFSRFKGKSVWNNFCDFYFRDFKWSDLWISVRINNCGFYFCDSVYSQRNCENKNPAKISCYTVTRLIYMLFSNYFVIIISHELKYWTLGQNFCVPIQYNIVIDSINLNSTGIPEIPKIWPLFHFVFNAIVLETNHSRQACC